MLSQYLDYFFPITAAFISYPYDAEQSKLDTMTYRAVEKFWLQYSFYSGQNIILEIRIKFLSATDIDSGCV